ncbi:MAG: LLM class flavin-dependent oxidoreductase [Methylobacterium sp.]|uniref:LLM class flavin-dependent oxidoreductase n=1 Tax=unclassified Methylobacterium TaxID=2615210 RepID=UPI0006F40DD1|nr:MULTISPECIES: LLM class flavin-dependent oxidoreductase [unclassified Methylobacterium]KQP05828.1 alkanesulfonate monooxygenase [Methylobacterium sp. Leaf99]MDO9427827.1 LLM class flavin-dependent oxidoreductase [Methylobacterium sp.]
MTNAPRFGIWAAVHGARAAHHDPDEPDDASWDRNRALVLEAEALGFDAVLVAQHTANPYDDGRDQLEAWTASAALAALTRRIEIIAAIKPGLYHPVVLAKMALQIEHIARGRFALNLVNAWNRAEFERAGLPFPAHDARYAYGAEWIGLVDRLMRGERVTHAGRHFRVEDYQLRPAGTFRTRPTIYLGGESEPARALAAERADVWFINGQPLDDVAALIADVAARPAPAPLRYGLSAFVIARETDAAAQIEHARLLALADRDAALRADTRARTDTASVMFAKTDAAATRHVGTNGGTAAGLVGSYDTVAARIRDFHAAGIDLFMLQFQPFEAEMRRFAEQILPRVR